MGMVELFRCDQNPVTCKMITFIFCQYSKLDNWLTTRIPWKLIAFAGRIGGVGTDYMAQHSRLSLNGMEFIWVRAFRHFLFCANLLPFKFTHTHKCMNACMELANHSVFHSVDNELSREKNRLEMCVYRCVGNGICSDSMWRQYGLEF